MESPRGDGGATWLCVCSYTAGSIYRSYKLSSSGVGGRMESKNSPDGYNTSLFSKDVPQSEPRRSTLGVPN